MKIIHISIIAYLTLMHCLVFSYIINVIQTAFIYTVIISGISSYLILIFSFLVLYSNVKIRRLTDFIATMLIICLPITLLFYLPIVYYKQIHAIFYPIFPSTVELFISISYQPLSFVFIFLPYFISLITVFFTYFYLRLKKS
jgi:hypothetical protein